MQDLYAENNKMSMIEIKEGLDVDYAMLMN